ncbi:MULTISPECIES: PadR family transcriptional regulator [Pantoea]|uniref:PadR family transcriptional regulator n=2 Tax=Pantoea brenneri TaxID=472694 RepID=A0A7Y6NII9_9GAMM|nr:MULTISPECIES: PadR family transcriptional regulator [Pantoea]KKD31654.1 transcriptional regulator [Pantoea sp. 3.5.1]MBS6035461.1 PadR family transcriptional regulator [Pantoea sp.]MBZ6397739.1 PadR family transcriptional regulator [Pantoea sp.]MBZ6440888.1 PadR family transcriptional regulator [Pantoea sp.]MCQ5469894.1 PadR family transcriptional regulator [Pantoea brenneri]
MKDHSASSSGDQPTRAGGCGSRRKRREKMLEASDIRLLMLHFLAQNAAHGYELIKSVEELSKGEYTPSPGIIYPNLTLLEEMEAIEVVDAQATRKAYRLTEAGEALLAANRDPIASLIARLSSLAILVNNRSIPAVEQAIHDLKMALNTRLAQQDISEAALQTLIAALQDAAEKITRS